MSRRGSKDYSRLSKRHARSRRDDDYEDRPRRKRPEDVLLDLVEDVEDLDEWSQRVDERFTDIDDAISTIAKTLKKVLKGEQSDMDDFEERSSNRSSSERKRKSRRIAEEVSGDDMDKSGTRKRRRSAIAPEAQDAIEREINQAHEEQEVEYDNEQPRSNSRNDEGEVMREMYLEAVDSNWIGYTGTDWLKTLPDNKPVVDIALDNWFVSDNFTKESALSEMSSLLGLGPEDPAPEATGLITKTISIIDFVKINKEKLKNALINVTPETLGFVISKLLKEETEIESALYYRYLDKLITTKINDYLECLHPDAGIAIDSYLTDMNDLTMLINSHVGAKEAQELLSVIYEIIANTVIAPIVYFLARQVNDEYKDVIPLLDAHNTYYTDKYSVVLGLDVIPMDNFVKVDIRNKANAIITHAARAHLSNEACSKHEMYLQTVDGRAYKIVIIDDNNVYIKQFVRNV